MELVEVGVVTGPSVVETPPGATTAHLKPLPQVGHGMGNGQKTIFIVDSLENADDTS